VPSCSTFSLSERHCVLGCDSTVLMYLSTPTEGGETIFPLAGEQGEQTECGGKVRPTTPVATLTWGMRLAGLIRWNVELRAAHGGRQMAKGKSVKAIKGRAVVFWSQTTEGNEDTKSLHGGCTVRGPPPPFPPATHVWPPLEGGFWLCGPRRFRACRRLQHTLLESSSRVPPAGRPCGDGLAHPADASGSNLAAALALVPGWGTKTLPFGCSPGVGKGGGVAERRAGDGG
jgi:hypothetical protein